MMEFKETTFRLLILLLTTSVLVTDVAGSSSECKVDFLPTQGQYVWMCNKSRSLGQDKQTCSNDGEGLVVGEMITSVRETLQECLFTNTDATNMTCLQNTVGRQNEYDQVFAEILNSVSGKHEVDQVSRIDPLPVTADGSKLTPFIAFKTSCKPVTSDRFDVVDICTNSTINYTRVYLVLKAEEHADMAIDSSIVCLCSLQAYSSITLQALDLRLQNSSNNQCGRSSIKFESEERSAELKCQDRAAWFGSQTLIEGKVINVTLRSDYTPMMVWLEGKAEAGNSVLNTVLVSCRTEVDDTQKNKGVPKDDNHGGTKYGQAATGDNLQDQFYDQLHIAQEEHDNSNFLIVVIIGCVLGLLLIAFIVLLVKFKHRLRNLCMTQKHPVKGYGLVSTSSSATSQPLHIQQPEATDEVYSVLEPQEEALYNEPQEPPLFSRKWSKDVPPPLPSTPPPPSSPTEGAPPKPQRSVRANAKEEYDHIDMNRKGGIPENFELMQNNNFRGGSEGDKDGEGNVYDHLSSGEGSSDRGTSRSPKKLIVDNCYAVPDLKLVKSSK